MLKIRKSNLNTLVYEVPKARGIVNLLLHSYKFELLEQILKYGYIHSVEYIDLFVEIRAREGFNYPKNGVPSDLCGFTKLNEIKFPNVGLVTKTYLYCLITFTINPK